MRVSKAWVPTQQGTNGPILHKDSTGLFCVSYSGLQVLDAHGDVVPSQLVVRGGTIVLEMDDRDADYPLYVDPVVQLSSLQPQTTAFGFGMSVGLASDHAVIGTVDESSACVGVNCAPSTAGIAVGSGAAYVYQRQGADWLRMAYLKASNTDAGDRFGNSVGISGDTIVVGAPYESSAAVGVNGNELDNSKAHSGAAYVFRYNGTNWAQEAYLKAFNSDASDEFGLGVAISGDTIVVGARRESGSGVGVDPPNDNGVPGSGAVYVFHRAGAVWSQQAYLKASNPGSGDMFGQSVAIHGDVILVGAAREASSATGVGGNGLDNSSVDAGAAYLYERQGGVWTGPLYLKASNTRPGYMFGFSVACSENLVAVGSIAESSNATGVNGPQSNQLSGASGAVYLFERIGVSWAQTTYLKASNTDFGDQFGLAVATQGRRVLVGAPFESSNATGVDGNQLNNLSTNSGAAYEFIRGEQGWHQAHYYKPAVNYSLRLFGYALGLDKDTAVAGSPQVVIPHIGIGAAHIIDLDTTSATFCAGDGSAGACPCLNTGAPKHGCAHSMSPQGALLSTSGIARVSLDSLVLHATNTQSGAGLYFQGTQPLAAAVPFGDGLLCVGGTITRLGVTFASGGVSTYPGDGSVDPPLSSVSGIAAGTTAYYQFWYRDAASFCATPTSNLTNGLSIAWKQ